MTLLPNPITAAVFAASGVLLGHIVHEAAHYAAAVKLRLGPKMTITIHSATLETAVEMDRNDERAVIIAPFAVAASAAVVFSTAVAYGLLRPSPAEMVGMVAFLVGCGRPSRDDISTIRSGQLNPGS